jgi:hypothetical protein
MGKRYAEVLCLAVMVLLSGCISLSRGEKEDLRTIRDAGFSPSEESVKSVPAAGALNILPGFGNFYLAIGTDESDQWIVGFLNLLTWPISVLWGIPEAAIDANTINKRETVYYFTKTEKGHAELQAAQARQRSLTSVPADEKPTETQK